MRLAFLISRLNHARHVHYAVLEAARRGHEVGLLCDGIWTRQGPKASEYPDPDRLPAPLRRYARLIEDGTEIPRQTAPYDMIVCVMPPRWRLAAPVARLQTSWSDVMDLREPEAWSVIYGWSWSWAVWWGGYQEQPADRMLDRFVEVGLPVAEHLKDIDPAEVRRTFGLPAGRPVVLYLPFPFGSVPWSVWTDGVYGLPWPLGLGLAPFCPAGSVGQALRGDNDRAVIRAIRAFCDRNNALLVVKSRLKNPVRRYTEQAADHVIEGDEPGQPTLLRLLTVAALMFHHYSLGVVEAGAAGVPAVGIGMTERQWPAYRRRIERDAWGHPMPWSQVYDRGAALTVPYQDLIHCWPRFALWTPQPEAVADYQRVVLGGTPFRASARMLDDLEQRVGERKAAA